MTTYPELLAAPGDAARPPRLAATERPAGTRGRRRPDWPLLFLAAYIGCQVALLFLGSTPLRAPLRVGAFSTSLGLLVLARPGRYRHPAASLLPILLLTLAAALFNPGQPSVVAAVAQATLYLATLAPLSWASSRPIDRVGFRRIVLVLWAYNALSAAVGVLQVYFPGAFEAQMSAVMTEKGDAYIGSLVVTLASGSHVLRPMGLTDFPGGAASGGLYAILFGVGLVFTERKWWLRSVAVAGMVLGLFVIYLTHIRVTFLMAGVGVVVIAAAFARRGDLKRVSTLVLVALGVAVVGTLWAFAIGGEETAERFGSLFESHPTDVYSDNRGYFLHETFFELLPEYPLGAGMGRWGMVAYYFGDPETGIWSEIMWSSWILDGGIPFLVVYCVMLGMAGWFTWRVGTARGGGDLAIWGAVALAYNVAAVAASFDSPVFGTQLGLELWFLNACLYNAWVNRHGGPGGRDPAARGGPAVRGEATRGRAQSDGGSDLLPAALPG